MILLSFDIEEFDMPKEYGYDIPLSSQLQISRRGLVSILDLLKKYDCKATFFSTVVFARENQDLIKRLIAEGHELASHTYYHSQFEREHLKSSKQELEALFQTSVLGLRMPRMMEVPSEWVDEARYRYNSSINPTYLPGRYKKNHISRHYFRQGNHWQIPTSVSTWFRIPLFWLTFHNFPLWAYFWLLKRALRSEGYAALYFHPWEFEDITAKEYRFPFYVKRNTGKAMCSRFEELLQWINNKNIPTARYRDLLKF